MNNLFTANQSALRLANKSYCNFYDKTLSVHSLLTLERQLYSVLDSNIVHEQMNDAISLFVEEELSKNAANTIAMIVSNLITNYDHNFTQSVKAYIRKHSIDSQGKTGSLDEFLIFKDGSRLTLSTSHATSVKLH